MVKYPDSKLKCFMRTGKNGAVYRTCATPEKKKQPKKQVRGDPKPASERKLPYLTTTGKKLPKSDRVIKEDDKPKKKPPLPPKSDKVKKRQQELKKKKEEPKKKARKFKVKKTISDKEVLKLIDDELQFRGDVSNRDEIIRQGLRRSMEDFYYKGAKNKDSKLKEEKAFKKSQIYQRSIRLLDNDRTNRRNINNLVKQFTTAYMRGLEVVYPRFLSDKTLGLIYKPNVKKYVEDNIANKKIKKLPSSYDNGVGFAIQDAFKTTGSLVRDLGALEKVLGRVSSQVGGRTFNEAQNRIISEKREAT